MPFWGWVGVETCATATARATATEMRARKRTKARAGLAWIRCRTSICETSCFELAASVAASKTLRRWSQSAQPSKHPPGTPFHYPFCWGLIWRRSSGLMNSPLDGRSRLSRRELEVAALVAAGLTNRQIAERLFISERTADGHLEHIREKLGVRSRSQITAWFVEQSRAPAAGVTPVELSSGSRRRVVLAGGIAVVVVLLA